MADLLEDLRRIGQELEDEGYEIDHYEVRKPVEDPLKDMSRGKLSQRAQGLTPEQTITDWEEIDSEDYVIEVFLKGRNFMDRVVYEPGEELEYISFSYSKETEIDELLEE